VDLYSASSSTHLCDAQVWHACSRDFRVLPVHPANGMHHTCLFLTSQSRPSFIDPGGMEGWLPGWLVTYQNKCLAPGIEPEHSHPSQY